jgi:hypothetical protein
MSNYLTRLLERTRGLPPQVEPLIAPLPMPATELFGEAQVANREVGLGPVASVRSAANDASANDDPGEMTVPSQRTNPVSPEIRLTESPRSEASAATPEFQRAQPEESGDRKEQRSLLRFQPEGNPGSTLPLRNRLAAEHPVEMEANAVHATPANQPASVLPSPARIVVQPQVATRRPSPELSRAAARSATANEPPAIHVTIGRVEVRAIMEPAPPRFPAPPPAEPKKISLQEYLKQRNGARS